MALAAVLLSASRFSFISPMTEEPKFNFHGCFNLYRSRFLRREKRQAKDLTAEEEKSLQESFDKLHWVKKIDERVDHAELSQCLEIINNFYQEQAAPSLAPIQKEERENIDVNMKEEQQDTMANV